ncbi:hypothetical protein PACILC2_08660 [Paenibacillus cisolokensis]|uniref:Catalase core domain-containing protein n=1 Tax=Paenibacillus cisolokensis TaxID=1658519 RepID=A0ABQ4N2E8_9BACL|nr:hypothetical protein PACILC2_08660 [Paenibacillus cisolokensis]
MTNQSNKLTTSWGAPVGDNQNSMTAGSRGPTLIQDVHLLEKLAHFNRERVPERVVHAKGAGAHGYFEVTNDVTAYTKAAFLSEVGKRTPVFVRFSTVAGESGSADTVRDPRGFAVKFYTEEGNYDLVGNNTPVFFIRDAIKFPDFIHTQKRHPQTHLKNPNAVWDIWSLSPESLHQVTILMSDRGIPATYRHMHGYGSHTFKWVNAKGEAVWVKYHFRTEQGIKNLTEEVARQIAGENPDYHTEDLFNAIAAGDYPAWRLYVQIMPLEDADTYRFDPFDVTKVWSQKDYPLIEVGRMVLNRNPENYFAEVEQATFSPGTLVPGIDVSPDKCCKAACSPTMTPTATVSARTIRRCRSTVRSAASTITSATGKCASIRTAAARFTTSRTATADRRSLPSTSRIRIPYRGRPTASLTTVTTTTRKPATCTGCLARTNGPGLSKIS